MPAVAISGITEAKALLAQLNAEQMREVDRYSQNAMAFDIFQAQKEQMRSDLDRLTAWSVGSLRYKKAYEPGGVGAPKVEGAAVYMADAFTAGSNVGPDEWLGVQIVGGCVDSSHYGFHAEFLPVRPIGIAASALRVSNMIAIPAAQFRKAYARCISFRFRIYAAENVDKFIARQNHFISHRKAPQFGPGAACPQVTGITTSALVHPAVINACGKPIVGPSLVLP